ncbi:hypothetical protein [Deinococcus cellulosilyticus]|uniref:Uncharacterized protein n=1 Tax=Deinococcus cellulosilyticus (strain DSM 18568 / NBRC 106333 / KACC 11606 / 5516J-15) TaxID=1223518 RepID=A0A511N992_DEIC1|nr:hypothetical protein [Deinococcus cellulosilyticus]GEM49058.1 hypothetical protein DC3_46930 [Deinococcus cellulosilyticus NBRC 106333 = KACC 11606]
MMNLLSVVVGIVAAIGLLVGLVPLLGWVNWFITLPLGIIGLILGSLSGSTAGRNLNIVILLLAALRLFLGGGIL